LKSRRSNSGLSLLEILIAIAIISTALVAILGFYNYAIRAGLKSKGQTELKYIAEQEMERLMSLPYSSAELDSYGAFAGKVSYVIKNETYLIKSTVIFMDPDSGETAENVPRNPREDTHLKKIIVSAARVDGVGGQIDLVTFKSP
jgi:prepilin-type N-terminal cleavage/methylation domain-containing protein